MVTKIFKNLKKIILSVTTQPKYINRPPSQIPIWEGMFQKSYTLHYENHISSKLY
jgi:hypothetical protein